MNHRPHTLSCVLVASAALLASGPAAARQDHSDRHQLVDCNGNGIPDSKDISGGLSTDCQGDGIPDECQIEPGFSYQLDDGEMDSGVGTNHDHICWLTSYTVQAGHEVITEVEIAWGVLDPGSPATLCIWSDPDGDGDPADAGLLASVPVTSDLEFTGTFVCVDVPDTFVGAAGTSFFVGVYGQFDQSWFPAGLDMDSLVRRSWWIGSDTPIDPTDLTSGAIAEYGLIGTLCTCDGDWTLHPIACATGHCGESADLNQNGVPDECDPDCNGNGLPDDWEIANGLVEDCDADTVPDECQLADDPTLDCDANGALDSCQASSAGGLVGQYYPNKFLGGPARTRIDPMVFFDFDTDPLPEGIPDDRFSVRWTGSFTTGAAGSYAFGVLHDDGVRLWVNGRLILDRWTDSGGDFDVSTIDLAGSTEYHIRLEYFENTVYASVQLHWQPPGGTMQPMSSSELSPIYDRTGDGIPDVCQLPDCNGNGVEDDEDIAFGSSLDCDGNGTPDECQPCEDADHNGLLDVCEAAGGNGLVGQYYSSGGSVGTFASRLLVQLDANVDFDWGLGSPAAGVPPDGFAVRWTGTLMTPGSSGTYSFHVESDDGVRLWLDGVLLIDEWHPPSGSEYSASVSLAGGTDHLLALEYYEGGGDARVHLRWTPPGGAKVPIPSSALAPGSDLDGDGVPDLATDDCNLNGVPDALELDLDGNCIPDACEGGVGYWRFEEAGGPTAVDSTGNGLDGTLNALPFRVDEVPVDTIPRTGAPNFQSLYLNWIDVGHGGVVTVPDNGGLLSVGGAGFTIEAWVKLDELSTSDTADERQWLCQKKPAMSTGALLDYALLVQAGSFGGSGRELCFRYGDGTSSFGILSSLSVDDLDWHHVSVAYDAASHRLRFGLDGLFETVPLAKPDLTNAGHLLIGGHEAGNGTGNQFLRGAVDEFRMTRAFLPPELLLDEE